MATDLPLAPPVADASPRERTRGHLLYAAGLVCLAAVYYAVARACLQFAYQHPSATPVWPPTGIALAALILGGSRLWPAVLAGAFLANLTTAAPAAADVGISIGNTLEAILGASLVNRFAQGPRALDRSASIVRWVLYAALLSTTVSATLGVFSLHVAGAVGAPELVLVWLTWWLGDAGGALVVAPFLLVWARNPRPAWEPRQALEILVLAGLAWGLGELTFGVPLGIAPNRYPLGFTFLPLLIWTAFRLDARATTTLALGIGMVAVWGTVRGHGPFAVGDPNTSLLIVQGFLGVSTTTALVVAAAVKERRDAQREAAALNAELERRVEQRTASLREMIGELDTFAYTVAHDLRTPLRAVHRFGDILLEDHAPKLDPEGRDCVRRMTEGAARMDVLIEDLLLYSRVARADIQLVPVDPGQVVAGLAEPWEAELRERNGRLSVETPFPRVMADPVLLSQCLGNLLSNAMKFTAPGAGPQITVSAARRGGQVRLEVRDRGIGIRREHVDRLFRIFERLHPAAAYPGTGVGLAIVKKAVERMSGQVGVDSEPGRGSVFWIELGGAP